MIWLWSERTIWNFTTGRFQQKSFFKISMKSKFRRNFILILSKFRCFHFPQLLISMSKLKFRIRFRLRHRNFDFSFDAVIGILASYLGFRQRNFEFGTGFLYHRRNFLAFFAEIIQNLYPDFLPEFWFRLLKSKFRLLTIIATNNFVGSRNYFWSEFRSKFRWN
jgi:hypothetical protein